MTDTDLRPSATSSPSLRHLRTAALVLRTLDLLLGAAGSVAVVLLLVSTAECEGELCGLGYFVAAVVAVPVAAVTACGVLSLALRRHTRTSFGLALAGVLSLVACAVFSLSGSLF